MQTFLPFVEFTRCARVLDDRRLGKQRVEALQILRALHLEGYGWSNHPVVAMWRGHTTALVTYGIAIVDEWRSRGYGDQTRHNILEFVHPHPARPQAELEDGLLPTWLGWPPLHRTHRSALLRKDPDHYRQHFPETPDDLDYVWPRPPAPPPARGPRSAWVVRSRTCAGRIAIPARPDERPWRPLDARSGRITKRTRQVARFIDEMRPGDLVVVPDADRLSLVTVAGQYDYDDGEHVRPVAYHGELRRQDLRFPAALQDPQEVFTLVEEPLLDKPPVGGRRP